MWEYFSQKSLATIEVCLDQRCASSKNRETFRWWRCMTDAPFNLR
jgi:hypothetical protein